MTLTDLLSNGIRVATFRAAMALPLVYGCSNTTNNYYGGDGGNPEEVTGNWCGREVPTAEDCDGDELWYMELRQSNSIVTGRYCEDFNHDCSPIQEGHFSRNRLTFFYTFRSGGRDNRVDADFELSNGGNVLSGELSDATHNLPVTLYKIP